MGEGRKRAHSDLRLSTEGQSGKTDRTKNEVPSIQFVEPRVRARRVVRWTSDQVLRCIRGAHGRRPITANCSRPATAANAATQ